MGAFYFKTKHLLRFFFMDQLYLSLENYVHPWHLNIQILICCFKIIEVTFKWTPRDIGDMKAFFLFYYRYICLLILWFFYSQNLETIVKHMLHNQIHNICSKFIHIKIIKLHWHCKRKQNLSRLTSNSFDFWATSCPIRS
jgi:hypothetical protein